MLWGNGWQILSSLTAQKAMLKMLFFFNQDPIITLIMQMAIAIFFFKLLILEPDYLRYSLTCLKWDIADFYP